MTTRRGGRTEPGIVPLLIAILSDRPNLPDAVCRNEFTLFDAALHAENPGARTTAQITAEQLCRGCPHTTACPDSLATRPHQEKIA